MLTGEEVLDMLQDLFNILHYRFNGHSKTTRILASCRVTFLFGCSSFVLYDHLMTIVIVL